MLSREEYVEQAYFFRRLAEQLAQNLPAQDVLALVREEVLATTKLPLAIDFMLSELRHAGAFAPAMRKLDHYFTPFQSFVIGAAEDERGRFDLRVALNRPLRPPSRYLVNVKDESPWPIAARILWYYSPRCTGNSVIQKCPGPSSSTRARSCCRCWPAAWSDSRHG